MEVLLEQLSGFVADLKTEEIPENVFDAARACVLDTVSVAVAAGQEPVCMSVSDKLETLFGLGEEATIWATGKMGPVSGAIFLNALMGHFLEMDDVHAASKAHIGTVVIPAAMALAEKKHLSGAELLTAVIAGYEAEARIAMAFNVKEHRKKGWHVTATAGVFGAAAACGKLLGFDQETMLSCLGLAGSHSFGTWAFLGDGTNSKMLNPAHAAVIGYEAAILTEAGITGPVHILEEKDGGLFAMMTESPNIEALKNGLGEIWEICRVDNKPYPCCRSTHCAIDSIRELNSREPIDISDIEEINIFTYKVGVQQCGESQTSLSPKTVSQAKFSTPYCVAAALKYGNVTLHEFTDEVFTDMDVKNLIGKIHVYEDDEFTSVYPLHWGCRTEITYRDRTNRQITIPDPLGSKYRKLTNEEAVRKAIGMFERIMATEDAEKLAEQLLNIINEKMIREVFRIQ